MAAKFATLSTVMGAILLSLLFSSCEEESIPRIEEVLIDDGQITNIEGAIRFLEEAPPSLELGALEDDTTLFVFAERKNHLLSQDLVLDMSQTGEYFPSSLPKDDRTWEALNPGLLSAGQIVNSYYFHYDNETYDDSFNTNDYLNCIGQYRVKGSISFKNKVLGIIMRAATGELAHLSISDAELGLPGVDYCEHNLRHFPGINIADGCRSDQFILSEDRKTLWLTNNTDIHHDNYRVIVEAD